MDLEAAFSDIANGNLDAAQFCRSVFAFAHLLDDMVDGDKPTSPAQVGVVTMEFIETIARNPFFQAHREALLGALRSGILAWVASEEWAARDGVVDRMASQVLKSHYQEAFFLVASFTGGMDHAVECSRRWRGYEVG